MVILFKVWNSPRALVSHQIIYQYPKVCTPLGRKEEEEVAQELKYKTKLSINAGGEALLNCRFAN